MAKPSSDYPQVQTAIGNKLRHEAQKIVVRGEGHVDTAIDAIESMTYALAELEAALPASSQATGTVVPTLATDNNAVASVTITDPGLYAAAETPTVTFKTAAGTTAVGTAVMVNRQVSSITVSVVGVYLDSELPITVTIAAPA